MNLRTLTTTICTTTTLCAAFISGLAMATPPKSAPRSSPTPGWTTTSAAQLPSNQSYLVRTQVGPSENLNTEIFINEKSNRAIRTEMEREYDSFEKRKNSGLGEATDDQSYFEKMKNLTRSAVNGLSNLHAKATGVHLKNYAETDLTEVRGPLAGAVLAAALYRGKGFGFKVSDDVRMESHTAIKNKESSLSMVFPGLTSSVYYTQADNISAKVSKHLVDNVSAELDTASKGTLQLKYGVTF